MPLCPIVCGQRQARSSHGRLKERTLCQKVLPCHLNKDLDTDFVVGVLQRLETPSCGHREVGKRNHLMDCAFFIGQLSDNSVYSYNVFILRFI